MGTIHWILDEKIYARIKSEKKERPNLSEAGNKVLEEALTYVTDNRLKNFLSKWEGPVTSKDFGRLMQLMNVDALEDLHKDFGPELLALEKEEIKLINKSIGNKASILIRKNFLNIIDNNFWILTM